jgi:hypothetical protein
MAVGYPESVGNVIGVVSLLTNVPFVYKYAPEAL